VKDQELREKDPLAYVTLRREQAIYAGEVVASDTEYFTSVTEAKSTLRTAKTKVLKDWTTKNPRPVMPVDTVDPATGKITKKVTVEDLKTYKMELSLWKADYVELLKDVFNYTTDEVTKLFPELGTIS